MIEDAPPDARPARNIVLCFDGTGDWVGQGSTNVAQIYERLDREGQCCFYDGGVGTLGNMTALTRLRRGILRLVDAATATNLSDKVLRGYLFLVRNYRPGDRIFLFGFSRGAYTARVVASMVHNFGILRWDCEHIAPYLWQTMSQISYASDKQGGPNLTSGDGAMPELAEGREEKSLSRIAKFKITANRIKGHFAAHSPKIEFMGLFDTVSSVGIVGRFINYPNTDRNLSVRRVCHAVAIGEQRNAFPEVLMHPGQPGLMEVWFPGVHRDVGGGLERSQSRLSDEALKWVEGEARRAGVAFTEDAARNDAPYVLNYPSRNPYVPLGLYPMQIFSKRVAGYRYFWPNYRHIRVIPPGSLIHDLAWQIEADPAQSYDPPNLPPPADRIRFRTGDQIRGPERYSLAEANPTKWDYFADFVGIAYGAALLTLLWNALLGGVFGKTWPIEKLVVDIDARDRIVHFLGPLWPYTKDQWNRVATEFAIPFSWPLIAIFLAFLWLEMTGEKETWKVPVRLKLNSGGLMPPIMFVIAVAVVWVTQWWLFLGGAVLGLLFFLVAQVGSRPVMKTDRVLPYLIGSLIESVLLGLAAWVLHNLASRFLMTIEVIERPLRLSFEHLPGLPSVPQLAAIGWLGYSLVRKILEIVEDRRIMAREDALSRRAADG